MSPPDTAAPPPRILPEIQPPVWAHARLLCPTVHGDDRLVWAEGRVGAPLGIILDNPGLRDDRDGRPFACPTRVTLQRALWLAGLPLEDIQVLFLFKCRPRGAYDREAAYRTFVPILAAQVRQERFTGLVALGDRVAAGLFGPDATVKALRDRPFTWEDTPLSASYHPLAARRRPNLLPLLVRDLRLAGQRFGLAQR